MRYLWIVPLALLLLGGCAKNYDLGVEDSGTDVTFATKTSGSTFSADNVEEMRTAINSKVDEDDLVEVGTEIETFLNGGALHSTDVITGEIYVTSSATGRAITTPEAGGGLILITAAGDYTLPVLAVGRSFRIDAATALEGVIGVTPGAGQRFVLQGSAYNTATKLSSAGGLGDSLRGIVETSTDIAIELIGTWAE